MQWALLTTTNRQSVITRPSPRMGQLTDGNAESGKGEQK